MWLTSFGVFSFIGLIIGGGYGLLVADVIWIILACVAISIHKIN